jgi:beta-glucosidase
VKRGCDLNCGETYNALLDAVKKGLIDERTLTRSVERLYTARFRLGHFDPPEQVPYTQLPISVVNSPEHRALALRTARESIVLLKNQGGLLPLRKNLKSIAVIGPNADDLGVLLGNYNGTPARAVTPLEGIRAKVGTSTTVYSAEGCEIAPGVRELTVIPSSFLRPDRADAGEMGLRGAYFKTAGFEGEPEFTRLDPVVNMTWKAASPFGGYPTDDFAVRWRGWLVPPVSGTYTLGVTGVSGYAMFLDGEEIFPFRSSQHHIFTRTKDVHLEAGRLYALQLDFVNTGRDPQIQLLWSLPGGDPVAEALEVARKAEAVVCVMGLSPTLEGEEMPVNVEGFAGGDRTEIRLPRPQEELIQKIHALGKPVVLVLLSGSALAVNWANEKIPAILEAWYPGEEGGTAIADVLFGDYNPAGRLPVTFYKSVNQLPPFEEYAMAGRTYRYLHEEPLYPFGHGLSYTRFDYAHLQVQPPQIKRDGRATISLDVRNAGDREGDEVVQLYVRYGDSKVARPVKDLKGFQRIALKPGESRSVEFTLRADQLAYFDKGKYVVEPGAVHVMVGSSSSDIRLIGELIVK